MKPRRGADSWLPAPLSSHSSNRGIAQQLLIPLTAVCLFIVVVTGGMLTLSAREAAREAIASQARAIRDFTGPLAAPAKGKPAHGWPALVNRMALAHGARVTVYLGGKSRTVGAVRVSSPTTYRLALPRSGSTMLVSVPGDALTSATIRSLLYALLAGAAGLLLVLVLGTQLVRRKVTGPLSKLS